jgi:hypothetical protein
VHDNHSWPPRLQLPAVLVLLGTMELARAGGGPPVVAKEDDCSPGLAVGRPFRAEHRTTPIA